MKALGKPLAVQLFVRLSYRGDRFFGVAPQPDGPSVQDAIMGRLHRAQVALTPYALGFAARTDRGVDALNNWLSFRVRLPSASCGQDLRQLIEALQDGSIDDGLAHVRAQVVPERLMARNCVQAKLYRYRLPQFHQDSLAADAELTLLQQAASKLSGTVHVARLAHPGAVRQLSAWYRGPLVVQVCPGDGPMTHHWQVNVWGSGFLRRQVRYMVGALQAVQRGAWSPQDVQHVVRGTEGPLRSGFRGPAAASGLSLIALLPEPRWYSLLQPTLQAPGNDAVKDADADDVARDDAFAPWLSVRGDGSKSAR